MHNTMRATGFLAVGLVLFAVAGIPGAAAPVSGPRMAGGGCDPDCDVGPNGDVDIYAIQLAASH